MRRAGLHLGDIRPGSGGAWPGDVFESEGAVMARQLGFLRNESGLRFSEPVGPGLSTTGTFSRG